MAISLLPFVRCYSHSTLGLNRGQAWFQDVSWFGVLFRLNYTTTPWLSVSSNQQQTVFLVLWSGNATLGHHHHLFEFKSQPVSSGYLLEKLLGTRPGLYRPALSCWVDDDGFLEEHGHRVEARSFPWGFLFMRWEMIGRIGDHSLWRG
ncbi:hypothetical protein O0I10_004850 [Lichtheimia ornata]|uniref:Uncharacterized protein n=1 Tax=Lichtheimia ornata TaxID=688661 RepID=A0AAD7V616_9FUNG|nr:uncharacterized protein O0I10_004850 [Lichtheimia ornata]KAJ8659485.1 hypothetical protein O0I10_004850 [Lichtheimia ornata]